MYFVKETFIFTLKLFVLSQVICMKQETKTLILSKIENEFEEMTEKEVDSLFEIVADELLFNMEFYNPLYKETLEMIVREIVQLGINVFYSSMSDTTFKLFQLLSRISREKL